MKDPEKRPKGKYTEVQTKGKYTKTEITAVGRDFKIMSFTREYNPGIKFPMTWEDIPDA